MKKTWLTLALSLGLVVSVWAQPPMKVMVLKSSGASEHHGGQILQEAFRVPSKSTVTLLWLGQGKRWEVTGPAEVELTPKGPVFKGGSMKELPKAGAMAMAGSDNDRQIGGQIVRTVAVDQLAGSRLEWVDCPQLAWTVGATPLELQYEFYEDFQAPDIYGGQRICRANLQSPFKSGPVGIQGGRYRVAWPTSLKPGEIAALRLVDSQGEEYFYARVRRPETSDEKHLASAREQVSLWAAQEPQNCQPWLVYARLLETLGYYQEALKAVNEGLKSDAQQADLVQVRTRLLLDCGRYPEALQSFAELQSAH